MKKVMKIRRKKIILKNIILFCLMTPKKKIKRRNYNDLDIFKELYVPVYDENKEEKDEINRKKKKDK